MEPTPCFGRENIVCRESGQAPGQAKSKDFPSLTPHVAARIGVTGSGLGSLNTHTANLCGGKCSADPPSNFVWLAQKFSMRCPASWQMQMAGQNPTLRVRRVSALTLTSQIRKAAAVGRQLRKSALGAGRNQSALSDTILVPLVARPHRLLALHVDKPECGEIGTIIEGIAENAPRRGAFDGNSTTGVCRTSAGAAFS